MKLTVELVRAIAMKHYEDGGDVVVECWDDRDIREFIEDDGTLKGLKRIFEINQNLWGEIRREYDNIGW